MAQDHASGEIWVRTRTNQFNPSLTDHRMRALRVFNNGNGTFSLCMHSSKLEPHYAEFAKAYSPRKVMELAMGREQWVYDLDATTAAKKIKQWRASAKNYGFTKLGGF